jgi:hypothetical protein
MRTPYAAAVFASAFLLFQIQPLIGRYVLPWFGGYAGVWSVMMVFFQTLLLAGYAYAHILTTRLKPAAQAAAHLAVLALAVATLPIEPSMALKPAADAEPIGNILLLLCLTVGAPYFAVSSTGPLLQSWYARTNPGRSPYALYAISNAASLLALLSYPVVVEHILGRHGQALAWSWGFAIFAVLSAVTAIDSVRRSPRTESSEKKGSLDAGPAPGLKIHAMWIGLPALASTLLLAFTNELCVDVASAPMLWVLPLSSYLLSFVVTFSARGDLRRKIWYPLAFVAIMGIPNKQSISLYGAVAAYNVSLFILCCVLHGETYRLRPRPERLTAFYLCVSVGGLLGGLFVGILAPMIFSSFLEIKVALLLCILILSLLSLSGGQQLREAVKARKAFAAVLLALNIAFGAFVCMQGMARENGIVHRSRNFYGTFTVSEFEADTRHAGRILSSGTTEHGAQYLNPDYQGIPTRYYTRQSGVGITLAALGEKPLKVGVIGLGVGTLATYGNPGDAYTFYEINPDCLRIARSFFTFLDNSRASIGVRLGDARLNLEREAPNGFNVLVVDAFTSDAIPMHLLTTEAFETYRRHLVTDGVICVNISNRHLDLAPVIKAASADLGLPAFCWSAGPGVGVSGAACDFVIIGGDESFLSKFEAQARHIKANFTPKGMVPDQFAHREPMSRVKTVRPWTDDFSNLFSVLKPFRFPWE